MNRAVIAIALLLTGCGRQEGDSALPLPRSVCSETVVQSNMKVCSNWTIGCPKPLSLAQITTGAYGKGEPILVCRLMENTNVSERSPLQVAPPL
ncbi:hypothetical protein QA639_21220 [Bradyrhizobium pachyrhizi]|uniref:hypothetical protein n=1 Tax=Bradyrhizobium pachyrhizi TaxID=280333 RepID=UPI0024B18D74|nr:hypothetical protein [Bradyrhizobium pachyrhizi]WFU52231.1 hypothetical protein QA639_21220 [Bradyrhizobium pachyrhizi]